MNYDPQARQDRLLSLAQRFVDYALDRGAEAAEVSLLKDRSFPVGIETKHWISWNRLGAAASACVCFERGVSFPALRPTSSRRLFILWSTI